MAISDRGKRQAREKMLKIVNKNDKTVYLVAQELKLAKVLAGNDKAARDRALKTLKHWFTKRSQTLPFSDDDFQRIWKGLFYSMWMSDKPLVQEECADNIAKLVHFPNIQDSLLFFKAGLTILINEWFGIDQLRLDKFLMLIRRLLRETLRALKQGHYLNQKNIESFGVVLSATILSGSTQVPLGLFMHFNDIFLEELAKVTEGKLSPNDLVEFLRPFIKSLATTSDGRLTGHIRKSIFTYLIRQSNLGLEYQAKYEAWKKQGFPGSIHSMQKVVLEKDEQMSSDDDDKESKAKKEKPLDPRAGRVDVEIPQLKVNGKAIAEALLQHKFVKDGNSKSRQLISKLVEQFKKLGSGMYPLGVTRIEEKKQDDYDTNVRKAANRLIKFEQKLLGKDKRKRKRENGEEKLENNKRRKVEKTEKNKSGNKMPNSGNSQNVKDLEAFIKKSEGNIKDKIKSSLNNHNDIKKSSAKKEKKVKTQTIIDNIECIFERNSGTWVVFDLSNEKEKDEVPSQNPGSPKNKGTPTKSEESPSISSCEPNNVLGRSSTSVDKTKRTNKPTESPAKSNKTEEDKLKPLSKTKGNLVKLGDSPAKNKAEEDWSPKLGLNPVKLFESPISGKELFPKSDWDEPLQEGEYEICIPSKKYVGKIKKLAKKRNQSVHELINTSLEQIKGKNRLSWDPSRGKRLFSTPGSTKKVKINVKLNRSQEVHEHHAQILSSPGIPYDANKKPLKPLLKTSLSSTPINPFYSKQLHDI